MKYTYTCKKIPLSDSIKTYAEKRLEKLEKYFHREDTSAFVTFNVEKDKLCTAEITIRDGSTILRAQTTEPDGDMRGAIDAAVSYIERQILKNKTRLSKRLRTEGLPAGGRFLRGGGGGVPHRADEALFRKAHESGGGHFADESAGP